MAHEGRDDDQGTLRLCAACIGEPFLKKVVRAKGIARTCSFCGRAKGKTFSIEEIADRVEVAFRDYYIRTSNQPDEMESLAQRHGGRDWYRHGEPIGEAIQLAAMIDETPATAIAEILAERNDTFLPGDPEEEQEFDPDSYYERLEVTEDDHFHEDWTRFERSLKSEARFFSRTAEAVLSDIFSGIAEARTRNGGTVIIAAGPGTTLTSVFRARPFQSEERLELALARPDLEVGPPPSPLARPGRMNARGVPVFYGATDERIAMAEVRPPVGADVIVAQFEIVRPLRLLDVAALGTVFVEGSIFEPTLAGRSKQAVFLQTLSARIPRPVMPDAEDFEYLVTQAMADYLADEPDLDLDGILFPSVQSRTKGANVVLFHKASRTALFDLPKGTEVSAFRYSGHDPEDPDDTPPVWTVTEETPASLTSGEGGAFEDPLEGIFSRTAKSWFDEDGDARIISLKIDPDSLVVHHITGVRFTANKTLVKRSRRVKRNPKF
ncbi:RES domain-containing protein [soil metagenome]